MFYFVSVPIRFKNYLYILHTSTIGNNNWLFSIYWTKYSCWYKSIIMWLSCLAFNFVLTTRVQLFFRGSDRIQSHQWRTKSQAWTPWSVFDIRRRLSEFWWRWKFVFPTTATTTSATTATGGSADSQASVWYDRDGRSQRRYRHLNITTFTPGLIHVQFVTDEFSCLATAPGTPSNAPVVSTATGAWATAGTW